MIRERMPKKIRIVVGCRVEGPFGTLMPNPKEGKTRRVRERVVGTVIASSGYNKWRVLFDFDGNEQIVCSKQLKVVDAHVGVPLDRNEKVSRITATSYQKIQSNIFILLLFVHSIRIHY